MSAINLAIAMKLLKLAEERFDFGRTMEGEAFAVPRNGPRVITFLSDRTFHSTLVRIYREKYDLVPPRAAMTMVTDGLRAQCDDQDPQTAHLRTGSVDGHVVIDLGRGDGKVVIAKPDGWSIEDTSPILFRRNALVGELPMPDQAGTIKDLSDALHIGDEVFPLVLGWMVAFLIDWVGQPILHLAGEAGAGKTLLAKIIKSILDPSPVPVQGEPATAENWARVLSSSQMIVLDNLSAVNQRTSDLLCRAVSGDGQVKRELYRNTDVVVTKYRRSIIVTAIDLGQLETDLVDRLILVPMKRITRTDRRSEAELVAEVEERRPKLLGALLNLVVGVLAKLPTIELQERPRMAAYAEVLAAIDSSLDTGRQHLNAYLDNGSELINTVIDGEPVAQLLVSFMDGRDQWTGTNRDLLNELIVRNGYATSELPRNERALRGQLTRLSPVLRDVGITIAFGTGRGSSLKRRKMTIRNANAGDSSQGPSTAGEQNGEGADSAQAADEGEDASASESTPSTSHAAA